MEMLRTMHTSHQAILQKLFGHELVDPVSSADVEEKVESVLKERNSLVLEVEELQRSVSGHALSYMHCLCALLILSWMYGHK